MGLDMYAYFTTEELVGTVDFKAKKQTELHYWRKHPNLHGWMHDLYLGKGGTPSGFNLAPVELTLEDLDRLEADIREGALPETCGLFFGQSDGTEDQDDFAFIAKAREAIAAGNMVYYEAWW